MRHAKWILLIMLCTAAGGYAVINKTYRGVERQQMQRRSPSGMINQAIDAPARWFQNITPGLQQSITILFLSKKNSSSSSIENRKKELGRWLGLFRWILFATAGCLFGMILYSNNPSPFPVWLGSLVFLLLGVSTPFLSIIVESASLPIPIVEKLESLVFYHKAKSIAGVMYSLFNTSRIYEWILGILIGFFSVVAPLVKLCVLPLLPASGIKKRLQPLLFRFAWVDVLVASIIVSFLATNQLLGANTTNSFIFTGHSQLEDGTIFFLLYLAFTAVGRTRTE